MVFAVIPSVHVCIACQHDDELSEAPKPNMILPYIEEDIHPASGMAMSPGSDVQAVLPEARRYGSFLEELVDIVELDVSQPCAAVLAGQIFKHLSALWPQGLCTNLRR
ncbi:hypothetical protein BP5796_09735 [Coleophoma crateriformis]|uniref:Uncharacterized protein n=1 Tax=Coleophoma crateriformis TaxID=565419 RepID=A0A3D8QYV7_9HELO|nr:hypothetical protein BP5796_09735 [Coleophoma crateriformis]